MAGLVIGLMLFAIVFGVVALFGVKSEKSIFLEDIGKLQCEINQQIEKVLIKKKFLISKKYYIEDVSSFYIKKEDSKQTIYVDYKNKKLCLILYGNKYSYKIIDFDEILNYEVYEDSQTLFSASSVGVGGAAVYGGKTKKNIKTLRLIIRLKRYDIPQISYDLIPSGDFKISINTSTETYRAIVASLQEIISFFELIKYESELVEKKGRKKQTTKTEVKKTTERNKKKTE